MPHLACLWARLRRCGNGPIQPVWNHDLHHNGRQSWGYRHGRGQRYRLYEKRNRINTDYHEEMCKIMPFKIKGTITGTTHKSNKNSCFCGSFVCAKWIRVINVDLSSSRYDTISRINLVIFELFTIGCIFSNYMNKILGALMKELVTKLLWYDLFNILIALTWI